MQEQVPNMLNKHPTAWYGLTAKEVNRVFIRVNLICVIGFAFTGIWFVRPAFDMTFSALGIILGCGISVWWCKYKLAPTRAVAEFGYLERKAQLNSIWVKLGLKQIKTIHETRLWRHFR